MKLDPLITLNGVTKKYTNRVVLHNVSLTINKGDFIVIRGNNGSGKSTLLKIICGLTSFTSGDRSIQQSYSLKIGYSPDRLTPIRMTSVEYLTHMGKISGIPKEKLKVRINYLHTLFNLEQSNKMNMMHFSKGMLQKLNLMQAMLIIPDVLVLDEPFSGLDQDSVNHILHALQEINNDGTSILAAVHETLLPTIFEPKTYYLQDAKLNNNTGQGVSFKNVVSFEIVLSSNDKVYERLSSIFPHISCERNHELMHYTFPKQDYPQFLQTAIDLDIEIVSLVRRENSL